MAEEGQTFTCQLVSVDNGGVLDPALDEARVYIPPNDKVEGVVSIDPSTRAIVAGEPVQGHDGVFVIRLVSWRNSFDLYILLDLYTLLHELDVSASRVDKQKVTESKYWTVLC